MKKVGIYKITSPSGKIYIGQSWDLVHRLYRYTKSCERHKAQIKLYNSFKKYGAENHLFEILIEFSENITQEELDNAEIAIIADYKSKGFNMLNLQEGGRGGKHCEESKLKMSNSHTGKKLSEDHLSKIVHGNTGLKRTEESKKKMSECALGRIRSQETKDKISESKKGQVPHNKGTVLNEEGRKKLRNASTSTKAVLQFGKDNILIKEYISISEAFRETGVKIPHITRVCKGQRPSAGNFIWKYK